MILYEYECEDCCNIFEVLTTLESRKLPEPCPLCGQDGYMVLSPTRSKLEGVSGDFPTAYDRWTKMHEREAKREPKDDGLDRPAVRRAVT